MLNWALSFLVLALIAALLGYAVVGFVFAWIARPLFFVFLAMSILILVLGVARRV